jgi:hypothetical protein
MPVQHPYPHQSGLESSVIGNRPAVEYPVDALIGGQKGQPVDQGEPLMAQGIFFPDPVETEGRFVYHLHGKPGGDVIPVTE